MAVPTVHLEGCSKKWAGTGLSTNGFAIRPERFSHEWLDRLLQAINELAPQPSRAGARHALRPAARPSLRGDRRGSTFSRQVPGRDAFPFRAALFDKCPRLNWRRAGIQVTALPLAVWTEIPGRGPRSVKQGFHDAHAPTNALNQVMILRSASMIRPSRMTPSVFSPHSHAGVCCAMAVSRN